MRVEDATSSGVAERRRYAKIIADDPARNPNSVCATRVPCGALFSSALFHHDDAILRCFARPLFGLYFAG